MYKILLASFIRTRCSDMAFLYWIVIFIICPIVTYSQSNPRDMIQFFLLPLTTCSHACMPVHFIYMSSQTDIGHPRLICSRFLDQNSYIFSMLCLHRTNRRAIAMMFVSPSVCLSGIGVYCDHMLHFSTDLSSWLDSLMFWTPWHQNMSTRVRVWTCNCKLDLDINTNIDK